MATQQELKAAHQPWPRRAKNSATSDDPVRVMRDNLAGLWVAILIGAGCLALGALAESVRREACVLRGARVCPPESIKRALTGTSAASPSALKAIGAKE